LIFFISRSFLEPTNFLTSVSSIYEFNTPEFHGRTLEFLQYGIPGCVREIPKSYPRGK
jgi:hypothetical protein